MGSPPNPARHLSPPNHSYVLKKPQFPGVLNEMVGQGGWKVPEGQQVSPDVEGLIVHLEKAEDTGSGRTLWMSVAKEDALFMEHLQGDKRGHRGETRGWCNISGSIQFSPRLCT